MISKTERFELRLDPELIRKVDDWRGDQQDLPTRAEAVRRLVEIGMLVRGKNDIQLSKPERLIVWMLTELLSKKPDFTDRDKMKLIQQAIFGGHIWALDWELDGIIHSHSDSPANLTFVVDVLDMWSFIEEAYAGLDKPDVKRIENEIASAGKLPLFNGFDGNNESELKGIADFLINQMGRFQSFKGRDLNSHTRVAERCRKMLDVFAPIRVTLIGKKLSADELIRILNTR